MKSTEYRRCGVWIKCVLFVFGLVLYQPAGSHFKLNLNIRIIHVEHVNEGVDVFIRLPMPYVVAHLVGPEMSDGLRDPAPFTTNATVDGDLMHYVDVAAVDADRLALGRLVAEGHVISHRDTDLEPEVIEVRLSTGETQAPFSTLQEAKNVFNQPLELPTSPPPFVGDVVVDVHLRYSIGKSMRSYAISSTLNPGLPGQSETANLILDHDAQDTRIFRVTGLLAEPQPVSRSAWFASLTFIKEGVVHILSGYDHLLYVACLVIGAVSFVGLAWRITGFTLGHSATLSLGYFGFVPTADWFIHAVETGIALSIILAAIMALSTTNRAQDGGTSFVVTSGIGLLHGLGFSFFLREIIGLSSANVWVSLLSFNVGVELGQLGVVMILWPLMWLIAKQSDRWHHIAKWLIALPAITLASIWTGERLIRLLANV